jgi:ribosomal protein L11 methylase PrmA
METLAGKSFLDVGSGSGLFSLAAMRLGAERVHSFDYDPQSVGCTTELKRRSPPKHMRGRSRKAVFSMPTIYPGWESSTSFTHGASCITRATCGKPWRV